MNSHVHPIICSSFHIPGPVSCSISEYRGFNRIVTVRTVSYMLWSHNGIQFHNEARLPQTPITALLLGTARSSEICTEAEFVSTHSRYLDLIRFGKEFSVPYIRIGRGTSQLLVTPLLSHSLVHRLLTQILWPE